jgi:hypothetical protein
VPQKRAVDVFRDRGASLRRTHRCAHHECGTKRARQHQESRQQDRGELAWKRSDSRMIIFFDDIVRLPNAKRAITLFLSRLRRRRSAMALRSSLEILCE